MTSSSVYIYITQTTTPLYYIAQINIQNLASIHFFVSVVIMDSKSKILVIGATGYFGKFILEASVLYGHHTFALVREQTFAQENIQHYFNNLGVNVILGDIYEHESLVNALKKVDVVISTVGHRSHSLSLIEDQKKIITAIKEAGNIKRFLPSEFGMDVDRTHNAVEPAKSLFKAKFEIRRLIEKENIPSTIVCAFYYARACLQNFFQPDTEAQGPPTESVSILGDGTPRGFFNMEEDIAMYTIKAVDDPRTLNKIMYIRPPGNMYSFNELVSLWENKIGKTLQRIYVQEEQLLNNIQDATNLLLKMILSVAHSVFVKGDQTNFEINPSIGVDATIIYPELEYTTVDDILNLFVEC